MTEKESEIEKENREKSKATSGWEWVIAAAGFILVVSAIGFTLYRAITEEKTPPKLTIKYDEPVPNGDGYLVKFHVTNGGNETAAAVTVEGELKNEDGSTETSTATLTYAPANSERRGGLYFTKNPQPPSALKIRVTGYEEP